MEIDELRKLAGIGNAATMTAYQGSNISMTGTEKAEIQRKNKIEPGTQDWFRLWFSLPLMTGEQPI